MARNEVTSRDRAFAATAGISATPRASPPETPSRSPSDAAICANKESLALPAPAYYIIFVEGCERFCYYGLKTILLLYFMYFLNLNKDSATAGFHLFSFACYFTPTFGGIISDGFIGRYWTIVILSIVYFIGTFTLTITAIPSIGGKQLVGPIIALTLIAVGTGGIKPCVSTFGADQISMSNPRRLSRYFAFFYFAINFGSLLSTIITPVLRSQVHCFGYDCYALAFGIPTVLMLTSIVIFLAGTSLYKCVPPKENIIAKFISIIGRAIRNGLCTRRPRPHDHWIYYADDKYSVHDIEDVRCVLRVFLLFTPIPIFYALFDQSGSRWTYQASLMNGDLGVFGTILPDQMQALNSLYVLILIPIFEEFIYPALARCNLLVKPLHRMICGMIVMIFAFIAAGLLQTAIEVKANEGIARTQSNIFNSYDCPININNNYIIEPSKSLKYSCDDLLQGGFTVNSTCGTASQVYKVSEGQPCPSLLIISKITDEVLGNTLRVTSPDDPMTKQHGVTGYALLRMVSLDGKQTPLMTLPNKYEYKITGKLVPTDYQKILASKYRLANIANEDKSAESFRVWVTGVYTALVYTSNDTVLHVIVFEDVPTYSVNILWQIIQYLLMTIAEILVSITGLVFAYSQAPKRYKSVIMSAWLLTTAFGDLIVVIVAEVRLFQNQAMEFFFFACLMAFGTAVFGILAARYKEITPTNDDLEDQELIIDKNIPEREDSIPLSN